MTYTSLLPAKAAKLSLVAVCFSLLLFSVSSSSAFTAYAQQGGAATGGSATGGQAAGGSFICSGGTCNFYGGPATGGQATGGSATGNGENSGTPSASPFPDINGLTQKGLNLFNLNMYKEAIMYFD